MNRDTTDRHVAVAVGETSCRVDRLVDMIAPGHSAVILGGAVVIRFSVHKREDALISNRGPAGCLYQGQM